MKNKLMSWLLAALFVGSFGGILGATTTPVQVYAADTCVKSAFLTLPPWYRGLTNTDCSIKTPDSAGVGPFIWTVVLNIIDMALQVIGYMAVGFIIYGGFMYMTSQGEAEGAAKARRTMRDAITGLVIAIASVAIVNLVIGIIK